MTSEEKKEINELKKIIERSRVRVEETSLKVDLLFAVLFAERPAVKDALLEVLKENPSDEPHITERVRAWLKG